MIRGSHERFRARLRVIQSHRECSQKMIFTTGGQGSELGFLRSGYAPVAPADLR